MNPLPPHRSTGPARRRSAANRRRLALGLAALATALLSAAGVSSAAPTGGKHRHAAVPESLRQAAEQRQRGTFDVLVKGDGSDRSAKLAEKIARILGKGADGQALGSSLRGTFSSVDAVQLSLTGDQVLQLAADGDGDIGSIVPNANVIPVGYDNAQKWDEATQAHWFWGSSGAKAKAPTIAVVDSGVSDFNGAFGGRLLGQVDLGGGSTSGDARGHGTFVAALAAGAASKFAGVAPNANIVALDVFDARGSGTIASVIRATDWILQNKDAYNIRVANFSLQSTQESSFVSDPLDQAIERLWHAGIVVVTSAGNYAVGGRPSGVVYAPANDPFVITVGAADIMASNDPKDDTVAPWSAYGYTHDGFAKPELTAPGRYLTQQLPGGATLFADFPQNIVKPGQLQISGTSFSAALVSGMAAALLGAHPDWTPGMVKGALMVGAAPLARAAPGSSGVGEVNVKRAMELKGTPPNPNAALEQFLLPDPSGGSFPIFDGESWIQTVLSNPSWSTASWSTASWSTASWSTASWSTASWSTASWSTASWSTNSTQNVANNATNDGVNRNY